MYTGLIATSKSPVKGLCQKRESCPLSLFYPNMLRRPCCHTLKSASRSLRSRTHSTVGSLVSQLQHEFLPTPSPLAAKLNTGQVTRLDELIRLRQELLSGKRRQNEMSVFSGVSVGVLEGIVQEMKMGFERVGTQTFVVTELAKMVRTGDVQTFKYVLEGLDATRIGQEAGKLVSKMSTQGNQKEEMYYILCQICSYCNNPILGAVVALGDNVGMSSASLVVRSLLAKDPTREEISLDLIIKIGTKYAYKFDESEVSQIMEKLDQVYDKSMMVKRLALFLLEHSVFSSNVGHIRKVYQIILNDAHVHNAAGVYLHWRYIMNEFDTLMDHDVRVLSVVLETMLKDKEYHIVADEIVSQLPERAYTHSFLVGPLLKYALITNKIHFANQIVGKLESPVPASVLSILLRMNMELGDYNGMEKVMQQINAGDGMTSEDYCTIVDGLLQRGDVKDAIVFAQGVPIALASQAYLKLIGYIQENGVWSDTESVVVTSLLEKMNREYPVGKSGEEFWNEIGALYIEYLVKNFGEQGIHDAKEIYLRSVKDFVLKAYGKKKSKKNSLLESSQLAINPFAMERHDTVRLMIDHRSKSTIVKMILLYAKKHDLNGVVDWGLLELVELGMSPREIRVDLTRKFVDIAQEIGLREWESNEKFVELWDKGAVEFVKEGVLQGIPETWG